MADRETTDVARWSQVKAERARQTRETLELVNAGWSLRKVAEYHGVSVKTVTVRYNKALKQYLPAQVVANARVALIDRLDTLTRSNLEMMAEAKKNGNVEAYARLHACQMQAEDRRINVMGLQAPKVLVVQQAEVEATPQETEMQRLLANAKAANEARRAAMGAPPAEPAEESAA